VDQLKIPNPLPTPIPLGKDRKGNDIENYTIAEYKAWKEDEAKLEILRWESANFREKWRKQNYKPSAKSDGDDISYIQQYTWKADTVKLDFEKLEAEIRRPLTDQDKQAEEKRRNEISRMESGKDAERYEGNPSWDDVVPIPQDDGEKPLAAISYTAEYAEGM
jgi:hypothetical protein